MRTKLDRVLQRHGISTLRLVRETKLHDRRSGKRGYSRNHIYGIRRGESEPTRECMATVLAAVRTLTGNRHLTATDLFDFEDRRKAS